MFSTLVASAWAETTKICVPEKPSKPVLSASAKNECPTKSTTTYKTVALPGSVELETLEKVLPHVTFVESGVAGKPTIRFTGVNVQVVNGEGKTESTNGEGNLVIGYDEDHTEGPQTGSHNLVIGVEQTFTSYGGLVVGAFNAIKAPYASVTGGAGNQATGREASISGGLTNKAEGELSSISGGRENKASASAEATSVSGGQNNTASAFYSSVSGGFENEAAGTDSSVFGGVHVRATNFQEACGGSPTAIC
jgi:hypothetical protein